MKISQKGFTLVEVMVAITVTSLILLAVYGIFSSVSRAKERLESSGEGYHMARVLFDRLGREIRGTYYSSKNSDTLFAGGINEEGRPFLSLSTTANTPSSAGAGIAIIQYELVPDPEGEKGEKILMRSESPLFASQWQQKQGYELAAGIEDMRWRFYSNGDWQEQWQEGLPQMIELTLLIRVDGQKIPFLSSFEIPKIQEP